LSVLRGYLKDIEADTINFTEIASIDKRLYFGVASDNNYIYILGGMNHEKQMLFKEVIRIEARTGASNRLPDMNV